MSALKKQNYMIGWQLGLSLVLLIALGMSGLANAQGNSFFGANAGGSASQSTPDRDETNINAGLPGLTTPAAIPPSGDYTDDEKRVQRKYKGNIVRAKQLIEKGESMMKTAGKDDKVYKKGKVFKETGEKWLAELKANDPYAGDKDKSNTGKDSGDKQSANKQTTPGK
jgi:hypothetical protein